MPSVLLYSVDCEHVAELALHQGELWHRAWLARNREDWGHLRLSTTPHIYEVSISDCFSVLSYTKKAEECLAHSRPAINANKCQLPWPFSHLSFSCHFIIIQHKPTSSGFSLIHKINSIGKAPGQAWQTLLTGIGVIHSTVPTLSWHPPENSEVPRKMEVKDFLVKIGGMKCFMIEI